MALFGKGKPETEGTASSEVDVPLPVLHKILQTTIENLPEKEMGMNMKWRGLSDTEFRNVVSIIMK